MRFEAAPGIELHTFARSHSALAIKDLGCDHDSCDRAIRRDVFRPDDRCILDWHQIGVGLKLYEEIEAHLAAFKIGMDRVSQVVGVISCDAAWAARPSS